MTNYLPLINLLKQANTKLKRPKIRLLLEDEKQFVVKLAGETSRNKGAVYLCGEDYGDYYGKIMPHNPEHISWATFPNKELKAQIVKALTNFIQNPAETANVYGKVTSNCCFCGLTLTAEESVTAGYGPICAENYGLPWGAIDKEVTEIVEQIDFGPQDEDLLSRLDEPLTLEDAFKQIAELRKMVEHLYHRNN